MLSHFIIIFREERNFGWRLCNASRNIDKIISKCTTILWRV